MTLKRKNKGRQQFLDLALPNPVGEADCTSRESWLDEVCQGFVCPSSANKSYYRVLLEELWPSGHGIPGPLVREDQLREAIDRYRRSRHKGGAPYRPYVDVFRRLRELQGEEGVTGIGRSGKTYQLINLSLSPKRIPRIKLSDHQWSEILEKHKFQCAVCSRSDSEVRLQQDHKVPRTRGGSNELENWQPLCDECNNFKSTSCRGCQMDCIQCPWSFPEHFAPLRLSVQNLNRVRQRAIDMNENPHVLLNQIVETFFKGKGDE